MLTAAKNPKDFCEIFQARAYLGNYMKEICFKIRTITTNLVNKGDLAFSYLHIDVTTFD